MRIFITIVVLASFLLQTFNKAIIVLDYYTNPLSFAIHCENKFKPKIQCNGICQMKKAIQEDVQKEEKNPFRNTQTQPDQALWIQSSFEEAIAIPFCYFQKNGFPTINQKMHPRPGVAIFHPPDDRLS